VHDQQGGQQQAKSHAVQDIEQESVEVAREWGGLRRVEAIFIALGNQDQRLNLGNIEQRQNNTGRQPGQQAGQQRSRDHRINLVTRKPGRMARIMRRLVGHLGEANPVQNEKAQQRRHDNSRSPFRGNRRICSQNR